MKWLVKLQVIRTSNQKSPKGPLCDSVKRVVSLKKKHNSQSVIRKRGQEVMCGKVRKGVNKIDQLDLFKHFPQLLERARAFCTSLGRFKCFTDEWQTADFSPLICASLSPPLAVATCLLYTDGKNAPCAFSLIFPPASSSLLSIPVALCKVCWGHRQMDGTH